MNSTSWIYLFIIPGGVLQTCGAALNAQLFHSLGNRWLASSVSFAVITASYLYVFAMFPIPAPTAEGLANMPWWAVIGGLPGAVSILVNQHGDYTPPARRTRDYENALGEWPEKHILGTQLGPNENGRHWPSRHERKHATP